MFRRNDRAQESRRSCADTPQPTLLLPLRQPYPPFLSRGPITGLEHVAWGSRQPCLCEAPWLYIGRSGRLPAVAINHITLPASEAAALTP